METAVIIAIISGAVEVLKLAPKWIKDAKERGELTPEQEAALDAKIASAPLKDHWQFEP